MAFDLGFGSSKEKSESSGERSTNFIKNNEQRERLKISDEAIAEILQDVLGGADGLASIFAGEQNAGIYNSSVAAQAAGELVANMIGEVGKLRAERIQTGVESGTNFEKFFTKGTNTGREFSANVSG